MAAKYKGIRLTTPEFRVSWPYIFSPQIQESTGAEQFSVTAIFRPGEFTDREKELWAKMKAELNNVSQEFHGKPYDKLGAGFHKALRDRSDDPTKYGLGEGTVTAKLVSYYRPGVIDRDRNPLVPKSTPDGQVVFPDDVYPGVYARATVVARAYSQKGNKGTGFWLQNIQITRRGERIDGKVDAVDDFEDDLPSAEGDDVQF